MRLLFISDVHPATPHISAVRLWTFACEMAKRGHQVVFVTRRTEAQKHAPKHTELRPLLEEQDWRQPLVLELETPTVGPSTSHSAWPLFRRIRTAWNFLVLGGPQWHWSRTVASHAARIVADIRPELIWTTFGHTSNLMAARVLARVGHCPWVLDIKDNWELYVPRGLRALMAWRTRGWAAITTNAEFTRAMARKWQGQDATVVYSGVDEAFLHSSVGSAGAVEDLSVNLIGGLYDRARLGAILEGLADWMAGLSQADRARVRIRYLGGDTAVFSEVAAGVIEKSHLDVPGYVAIGEMARLCGLALANIYVRHEGTFHHKLLELLACGRPAAVFPSESPESWGLVKRTGGRLVEVSSRAAVCDALAGLMSEYRTSGIEHAPRDPAEFPYTWANLAIGLEAAFASVNAGRE